MGKMAIVITPVYNARKYIKACVLSVADQLGSYPNMRHIVVDDYSDDGTYERLREDDLQFPHLTVVRQPQNGASALGSFMRGIREAEGFSPLDSEDVIFWVDGDDWLCDKDAIKKMMRPYDRNSEVEMAYSDHITWFGETKVGGSHSGPMPDRSTRRYAQVAYSHLRSFKVSMLDHVHAWRLKDENDEYWKFAGDSALFLPMLEVVKRVKYVQEPLYVYNMEREDNEIKKDPWEQPRCSVAIRDQKTNLNNRPEEWPQTQFAPTGRFKLDHGRACNLSCKFCYYLHEKPWKNKPTEQIEQEIIAGRRRGNKTCDISGGEPTIAKDFMLWLQMCKHYGLSPGIITHGQDLEDKLEEAWDNGLGDILFSVHGLEKYHNEITGTEKRNGFSRLKGAMAKCFESGFKFRTNTVLTENFSTLPVLAKELAEYKPYISNFINFNPYYGWKDAEKPFQARISEIAPSLQSAIDILVDKGTMVNVRYMPFCLMKGYEKHLVNMHQVMFDPYEWDYNVHPKTFSNYVAYGHELARRACTATPKCAECSVYGTVCPGPNRVYYESYGDSELKPYGGKKIDDPFYWRKDAGAGQLHNYVGQNFRWTADRMQRNEQAGT